MKIVSGVCGFVIFLLTIYSPSFCNSLSQKTSQVIEKHTQFLSKITCLKTYKIHFSGIHFNNIILIKCLQEIEETQSFVPLLKAWQKIQHSPEVSTALIGQYALILLLSYHVSLGCYTQQNRLAWLSLISLYTQLNMIPLDRLFDALDECYQQYKAIIENLPGEEEESLSSWLQNYWWAPATIFIFTLYSFLRWKQKHSPKHA